MVRIFIVCIPLYKVIMKKTEYWHWKQNINVEYWTEYLPWILNMDLIDLNYINICAIYEVFSAICKYICSWQNN